MKQLLLLLTLSVGIFSCKNKAAIEKAKMEVIDSVNNANAIKQQVIDSIKAVEAKERAEARRTNSASSTAASTTTTTKKKGWSNTAKGAVIGAGVGAGTGAIINHNDRLKGAAVGTLIGAGVGAGTGAIIDHNKKKQE